MKHGVLLKTSRVSKLSHTPLANFADLQSSVAHVCVCYHGYVINLLEIAMLKSIIVLLLIGILISLIVGFVFFYKDQGRSKRVLYALGVRVTLAVIMMACVFYGLTTGELTLSAPWL